MNLKKFKKLSVWACSGLLVSLFSGLIPLNDNLCNLNPSMVVYAEGRVFNDKCIDSTTYDEKTKTLTIPDGFTEIGTRDLARLCPDLEIVNIPDGVEIIGNSAFLNCKNLTKVYIRPSSKLKEIDTSAFEFCSSLKKINLPESVEEIGCSVFHGCCSLENINIPNNVHTIGEMAFKDCTALRRVVISESCEKIGEDCFAGCPMKILTNDIALKMLDDPKIFYDGVFDLSSSDFEYMVPNVFNGESFYKVKTLKLPGKLKEINKLLFGNQSDSTARCNLSHVVIPRSVRRIGSKAFSGCHKLQIVDFIDNPNSESKLIQIDDLAFSNTAIEKISIPGSCRKIGEDCFKGCKIKILTKDIALKMLDDPKFFHDGVFDLSSSDFEYMVPHVFDGESFYEVETLKLPGKLKEVGESLCEDEFGFAPRKYNLKHVVIPASVTKISREAFYGMGIEQVTIVDDDTTPSQLICIEDEAFGNTRLKDISIPKKCKLGKRCFLNSDLESAIVPFDIDSLPESTFDACSSLKKVTIPTTVKSIGKSALYSCHKLKYIDFIDPKTKKVTRCNLENFEIPQHIINIGEYSFGNNFIIRSIKLPPNLHIVKMATFQGCENLEKVECNKELEEIEESAFWGSGLRHFTAPEKVNSIKKDAFGECVKLGSIEALGEEISLGENCCDFCQSLQLMSFPNASKVTVDESLGVAINENFALFMPPKPQSQSQLIVNNVIQNNLDEN